MRNIFNFDQTLSAGLQLSFSKTHAAARSHNQAPYKSRKSSNNITNTLQDIQWRTVTRTVKGKVRMDRQTKNTCSQLSNHIALNPRNMLNQMSPRIMTLCQMNTTKEPVPASQIHGLATPAGEWPIDFILWLKNEFISCLGSTCQCECMIPMKGYSITI